MIAAELMTPFLNEVPILNYTRQYETTALQKNFTNKFNELLNSGENLSPQQLQTFLNQ